MMTASPSIVRATTKRLVGLLCGYVGDGFHGSLRNCGVNLPTVEEELENALGKCHLIRPSNMFDSKKNSLKRSSRTDKGVSSSSSLWTIKLDLPRSAWAPVDGLDIGSSERKLLERSLL